MTPYQITDLKLLSLFMISVFILIYIFKNEK